MLANPKLEGAVLDLPHVLPDAVKAASEKGLQDRFSVVEGDFFKEVPRLTSISSGTSSPTGATRSASLCARALGMTYTDCDGRSSTTRYRATRSASAGLPARTIARARSRCPKAAPAVVMPSEVMTIWL
jgi:O-methyltransferase